MDQATAQPRRGSASRSPGRRRAVSERYYAGRTAPRCRPFGRWAPAAAVGHLPRNDLPARFAGRLLGIDAATADAWGRLIARRERAGRPMGVMDGWIAAVAEVYGLVLVTRNAADFAGTLERVASPWTED